MTPQNISFACDCGKLHITIANTNELIGGHFVCMCDDCQTYAHALGRAQEILDKNGGTDILPVYPANFKITQGMEHLSCLRLSPNGLFRWYASCCKTALGNSPANPKMPYVGVVVRSMKLDENETEILGPVQARVMAKYGHPPLPPDASQSFPFSALMSVGKFMILGWLKRRAQPSPVFNEDGTPKVVPQILTKVEREHSRLQALRDST